MSKLFARLAAALILAALWTTAVSANSGERYLWHPWFEVGGFYNSGNASRGEGILFTPLMHGQSDMLFADIRMKFFQDDVQEGNFAIGYRQMSDSGFNYGAWIGADVRDSEIGNRFSQLSGGFEALSHNLDFRLNWYGPGTDARAGGAGFTQVALTGNNIFMVGGQEVQLKGIDGEIGIRLPVEILNIDPNKFELRAFGGGYYFDDNDALKEVAGGKARVTLAMNDIIPQLPGSRLTLQYQFTYDDVRDERHEVGGRLRIPLSAPETTTALSSMSHQERRMMEGLERDTDIITAKSKRESVEDALTSVDFDRVALVNNGGSITNTSNTVGANSLLIVNGTITGAQQVQANQTVQGGGSTIQVRGRTSGTVVGFTAAGSRPTVTSGAGNILTLQGSNTQIAGLLVDGQGTSGNGILGGSDRTNIVLASNAIQNTGGDGINFNDNNTNIKILDTSLSNTGSESIIFDNDNSNVTISGVTISSPNSEGIEFDRRNTNIVISNTTITNSDGDSINFDDDNTNILIENVNILNSDDDAIVFDNNNSNIMIRNVVVTGANYEGFEFDNDNSNITIANTTLTNIDETAIEFDERNTNILITGVTINGVNTEEGIFADNDNSITVVNSSILNTADQGIEVDNNNTLVVRNTIFNNIGNGGTNDHAIDVNDGNTVTIEGNQFGNISGDAIRINNNNTVGIATNVFNGPIGGQLLDVDGAGSALSGTGNVANTPITCQSGTFTGTVSFVGGTVLQDGVAPCN